MARHLVFQRAHGQSQHDAGALDVLDRAAQFGPWLTTAQVALLVPNKTVEAACRWIKRKGLVRCGDGTVSKRDVLRAKQLRSRKGRHVNSLANLKKGA